MRALAAVLVAGVRVARTGTVLIIRPTIASAPATSVGRPDTAVPNTTSECPVSWASTWAKAPWSTTLTVVCRARARSPTAWVIASGTSREVSTMVMKGTRIMPPPMPSRPAAKPPKQPMPSKARIRYGSMRPPLCHGAHRQGLRREKTSAV